MTPLLERLGGLFSRPAPADVAALLPLPDPQPDIVYAVGDVHGCLDLFRRMEEAVAEDAARTGGRALMVLLGDVVDRGPDSAGMIDHLLAPPPAGGLHRICLRGNHEDMMARFLARPRGSSSWLDFGGFETLMSYGLRPPGAEGFELPERRLQQMLQTYVPQAHLDFFDALPLGLQFGRFLLVHAALDPAAPLDRQPRDALLWGRAEGLDLPGRTLVHGHTIVENVVFTPGRIAVDTGAYATGRLSAVRLHADGQAGLIEVTQP